MKISKEVHEPVYPPTEYHLVLNEEEYRVLRAAIAVGKFADIINYLEKSSPIVIDRPDTILYQLHNDFCDWKN